MASPNQNIQLRGKQYSPNQGQIPANQQAARAARAAAPRTGKPKSAGQTVKDAIGGFIHRGAQNFVENMRQPIDTDPGPAPRGSRRKGGSHGGSRERSQFAEGPMLNPDILDLGGDGIDFSMHPDPMYHNIGGSRRSPGRRGEREGAKSVTVTRTTYHY